MNVSETKSTVELVISERYLLCDGGKWFIEDHLWRPFTDRFNCVVEFDEMFVFLFGGEMRMSFQKVVRLAHIVDVNAGNVELFYIILVAI